MSSRWPILVGLTLIVSGSATLSAQESHGASSARPFGTRAIWSASLDGALRAVTAGCSDSPHCPLFLLVEKRLEGDYDGGEPITQVSIGVGSGPESGVQVREYERDDEDSGEWSLYRWDPEAPSTVTPVFQTLPTAMRPRIERVDHGDGADGGSARLVLFGSRGIWLLPVAELHTGGSRELDPATYVDSSPDRRKLFVPASSPHLLAVGSGELEVLDLQPRGGSRRFRLPVEVRRRQRGLELITTRVEPLGNGDVLAIGPQSNDNLRLRTLLLETRLPESRQDSHPNPIETWSVLPRPERLLEAHFERREGRTFLFAVTLRADKVSLFEKKKLRLFELVPDRTRLGRRPLFETLTASRIWQSLEHHLVDVNADGLEDLVLLQPEGLGGKKLIIDLFLANGQRSFESRPFRTVLPGIEEGTPRLYGDDWNGDGVPDLVVVDDGDSDSDSGGEGDGRGEIRLFPGRSPPRKKSVIESQPAWRLPLPATASRLRHLERIGGRLVAWSSGEASQLLVLDL